MTDRLESWKEIAAYLKRSVRTVRRWESEEGLPVHRHMHQTLGTVYAYRSEIDAWRQSGRRAAPRSAAPPPAMIRSIAVLPFADLSEEGAGTYFADGLAEEIIAGLAKVRSLRVISSTSSRTLRGTKKDVRTIGRELNVQCVLEGTVRRAGKRLRVSARLIDTSGDDGIWSGSYDGAIEEVFDIQESLARTIVNALQVQLTADEDQRLSARPLDDVHAYECFLQARQAAFRWRRDAIDHAVQLLHNGLKIVGENAELYAALGRTHLQYRESGIDLSDRPIVEAERCAENVARLEPRSTAAASLRGWIQYSKGNIQNAVRELKAAMDAEWSSPDVLSLLSNCYLISGRVSEARPLIERLLAVDPLTPLSRCMPGFADLMEGRFADAVSPYREMFEMDPGNPMGRLFYTWVLAMNGQRNEAIEIAGAASLPASGSVPARITSFLGQALAGNPAAVAILPADMKAVAGATDVFPRFLAHGYAWAGLSDLAMDWLTVGVDRGFINYPFLADYDPVFRPLRSNPRFASILGDVRRKWQAFEA